MKTIIKTFLLLVLGCPFIAGASEIQLTDGTRINGEVLSMSNGMYTIRSSSLGLLQVEQAKVLSINNNTSAQSYTSEMAQIKKNIAGSPALQKNIMDLQQNPQLQAILNDPDLMRSIQTQDLQSLQSNPKIQALMNSPDIRALLGQIK